MNGTLATAGLAILVVTAGCAGLPGSDTPTPDRDGATADPPYFAFANNGTEAWDVSLYLLDGPSNQFEVTFSNGTTKTVEQYAIPGFATRIEPAAETLARGNYTVGPGSNLWVSIRGCEADTHVWFIYEQSGTQAFSYGPAIDCDEYPLVEYVTPNGGGTSVGGDYSDLFDDPATRTQVLTANRSG